MVSVFELPDVQSGQPANVTALRPLHLALIGMAQIHGQAEFATREELLHITRRAMQLADDLCFLAREDAGDQPRRRAAFLYMAQVMAAAAMVGPDELKHIAWRAGQTANDVAAIATRAGANRLHMLEQLDELRREKSDRVWPAAA